VQQGVRVVGSVPSAMVNSRRANCSSMSRSRRTSLAKSSSSPEGAGKKNSEKYAR